MKNILNEYKDSKFGLIPKEWNVKKLKDVAIKVREKNKENLVNVVFSNSAANGVVLQKDFFNKEVTNKNNISTYYLVKQNEFIYNPRISVSAPCGPINRNNTNLIGVASPLYTVFNIDSNKVNLDYIENFFKSSKWHFYMHQVANYGARSDRMNITDDDFFNMPLLIPTVKEQEKIAEILSTWDLAIEKQQQLIKKKKEFKKGLMQILYAKGTKKENLVKSKLGEVPESWNVIKAKEVFKSVSIKNNENEELLSVTQDKGTIPRSQLEGNVVMPDGSTKGYKLVVPNNFIISLRSFQGGLEMSKHRGIISPAYTVLENKIDICHDYFKYYFKKEEFISRLNGIIVGIRDGKQISYADFGEIFLPVPPIEEQRKIAEILILADKEIELLEKELEALKLQKKGLMQRLLTGEVRVKI